MALSAYALCTLGGSGDGLKDELSISGSDEDTRLERLIESVSKQIINACGVPSFHYEAARVDDLKGYGTPLLHTPKTPLLDIGSIVFDPQDAATTVSSSEYLLDSEEQGRIYRDGGWLWTAASGQWMVNIPYPGTEESLYRVTYECGYKTRNQIDNLSVAGSMTLPEDIEDAALMLAAMRYRWTPRGLGIKSERLLSWSASYDALSADGLPFEVSALLAPYKKVVWA